jgi:O-antigen ligase
VRLGASRFITIWGPWAAFFILMALFSSHLNSEIRGVIYITPILVGLVASNMEVSSAEEHFMVEVCSASIFLVAMVVGIKAMLDHETAKALAVEAIAMVILGLKVFSGLIAKFSLFRFIAWGIAFIFPFLAGTRMAAFISIIGILFYFNNLSARWKIVVISTTIVAALFGFVVGGIYEKTVVEGATIEDIFYETESLQTSGRRVAWEHLTDKIPDAIWFGHGSNSTFTYLTSIYVEFDHPHNDWLRLLYEYGVIGVAFFIFTVTLNFIELRGKMVFANFGSVQFNVSKFAFAATLCYLLIMITDNILLYAAFFGNLLFLNVGMAYSFRQRKAT